MKRLVLLTFVAAFVLLGFGCKSHPGSREYTPGKGWQQN
jgi:hypothetical protein